MVLLVVVACASSNPQRGSSPSSAADSGSQSAPPRDGGGSRDGRESGAPPDASGEPRDGAQGRADGATGDAAGPQDDASMPTDAGGAGGSDAGAAFRYHACPLVDICGSHQGAACPAQPPRDECTGNERCFYCVGAGTRPSVAVTCEAGEWLWSVPQPCAN